MAARANQPDYSIDRREFLTTLVLIPIGAKLAGCGDEESATPRDAAIGCPGLSAESSEVGNHTHFLCIPQADLDAPPKGGGEFETESSGHTHTVTLSQKQLQSIADGTSVMVTTSEDVGHAHGYILAKAGGSAMDAGAG